MRVQCPICFEEYCAQAIEQHVNTHFESAGSSMGDKMFSSADLELKGFATPSSLPCPFPMCNSLVNHKDWEDHVVAHEIKAKTVPLTFYN